MECRLITWGINVQVQVRGSGLWVQDIIGFRAQAS